MIVLDPRSDPVFKIYCDYENMLTFMLKLFNLQSVIYMLLFLHYAMANQFALSRLHELCCYILGLSNPQVAQ